MPDLLTFSSGGPGWRAREGRDEATQGNWLSPSGTTVRVPGPMRASGPAAAGRRDPRVAHAFLLRAALLSALSLARVSRRLRGAILLTFAMAARSGIGAIFGGRGGTPCASPTVGGGPAGSGHDRDRHGLLAVRGRHGPVVAGTCSTTTAQTAPRSPCAALCVYLLGLFFASVASAIADLGGSPDFAGHRSADSSDQLYLSFTSLATVAYGRLSCRRSETLASDRATRTMTGGPRAGVDISLFYR